MTARYTFTQLISALQDSLQLTEELKRAQASEKLRSILPQPKRRLSPEQTLNSKPQPLYVNA